MGPKRDDDDGGSCCRSRSMLRLRQWVGDDLRLGMLTRRRAIRLYAIGLIWVVSIMGSVESSRSWIIGTGIQECGIFVQEFWDDDEPYYLVANVTDTLTSIRVHEFFTILDGRMPQTQTGAFLSAWELPARSFARYPATDYEDFQYIKLVAEGIFPGIFVPMVRKPGAGNVSTTSSERIRTESNMNHTGGNFGPSGGAHGRTIWFEHESMRFPSDQDIQLSLIIRGKCGVLALGTCSALWSFIDPDSEFEDEWIPALLQLEPIDGKCLTLPIQSSGPLLIVDSDLADSDERLNQVSIRFRTPSVDRATPVAIYGHRRTSNMSHWISRMIVVEP